MSSRRLYIYTFLGVLIVLVTTCTYIWVDRTLCILSYSWAHLCSAESTVQCDFPSYSCVHLCAAESTVQCGFPSYSCVHLCTAESTVQHRSVPAPIHAICTHAYRSTVFCMESYFSGLSSIIADFHANKATVATVGHCPHWTPLMALDRFDARKLSFTCAKEPMNEHGCSSML